MIDTNSSSGNSRIEWTSSDMRSSNFVINKPFKESVMNFANLTNRGIFNSKGTKQPSNLFGARGMTITHIPKAQVLTTRLSLIDRVKKQLLRGFERKDVAMIWPHSYEIQMIPTHRPKAGSPSLQQGGRPLARGGAVSTNASGFSGRYRFANKATREKLAQTSSNLG
jgi:hypothetical protein